MRMALCMFMLMVVGIRFVFMAMFDIAVRMLLAVLVMMALLSCLGLLFPEFFAWKLFFSGGNHIQFYRTDAAALHPRNLQAGIHAQCLHGLCEDLRRYSGIQQRAQKHVAADPGEALKISNPHSSI